MSRAREIKGRIRGVQNTRKITRTMEMVATSKLKRAQDRLGSARPYSQRLREVIGRLLNPELAARYALLRQPEATRRVAILLVTSNRGLAGAFNANLTRAARTLMSELRANGVETELHVVGRKGISSFRFLGEPIASDRADIGDRPTAEEADSLVDPLMERFIAAELDGVYVIHARFISALSTPPNTTRVLPIEPPSQEEAPRAIDYILEPSADAILEKILPLYVRNSVYTALLENAAAEQGARRTAMKSATDNAGDMLQTLTRTYNRARQAAITQEIAEIVGGAAALE
ncbi:MAG: ATP synthase F1 subunit gamma [Gemmatimonas sp.]|nr:ATP synthase F1 subunit gamma [Gemmatimonas sp.]